MSVDKAGNIEKVQSEVIDDAPNNLRTAEPLSDGAHVRRTIKQEDLSTNRRGKATEKIRKKLTSGRYYIRVVGYEGDWHPRLRYQLKLQTLG